MRLFIGFAFITGLLTLASAQIVSPCIITCVQPIAEQNGCMFQNTTCVCGNAKFQSEAAACLEAKCTGEEQQEAIQLEKRQCGPLGITPATPGPTSTSSGPSDTPTTTSAAGGSSTSPVSLPRTTTTRTGLSSSSATPTGTAPVTQINVAAKLSLSLCSVGTVAAIMLGLVTLG